MKILLIATAWPWPARKGHQLRSLQLASILAREHEVTLLAPEGPAPPVELPYRIEGYRLTPVAGLAPAVLDDRALQAGLFDSADLERRVGRLARQVDLTILQTVRLGGVVRALSGAPFVVDLIDSLSLNFERRAIYDRFWLRPLLRHEARRLAGDERRLVTGARAAALVCARDRDHVAAALPADLAERLAVVPLVIPIPAPTPARPPAERFRVCLTGNLGYFPTAHGAVRFLDEAWPRVRERLPAAALRIAGTRPPKRLVSAARRAGAELVLDPSDLGAELAASNAAVVPLFAGSGVPVKLLEALAAGVPAVATPWAAAGLEPELFAGVTCAESADDWVKALVAIHDQPAEASDRARTLRAAVARLHSEERVGEELARLLSRA